MNKHLNSIFERIGYRNEKLQCSLRHFSQKNIKFGVKIFGHYHFLQTIIS